MPVKDKGIALQFAMKAGVPIEKIAPKIVSSMHRKHMDAYLYLPDGTTLEIERSCKSKEIVDKCKSIINEKNSHSAAKFKY